MGRNDGSFERGKEQKGRECVCLLTRVTRNAG